MYTIATLTQLQQYLGLLPGIDDARLKNALTAATAQLESLAQRRFLPRYAVIRHHGTTAYQIVLQDDLLALTMALVEGAALPLEGITQQPQTGLLLLDHPLGRNTALDLFGFWGWHDRWSQAWVDSHDTLLATLDATNTSVTIASINGMDAAGESPRFAVGQLLRVEGEYMQVVAVTVNPFGADALTVIRGVNGTQATAHALSVPIATYAPPAVVVQLATRWAAWLYKLPDYQESQPIPPALLQELAGLRRVRVAS